jgi:hypothetical protein
MGDGRKWAAEQDEIAAEERLQRNMRERVHTLRSHINSDTYAERLLRYIDESKEVLVALRLGDKPLRYEDHVQARKLSTLLDSLTSMTR